MLITNEPIQAKEGEYLVTLDVGTEEIAGQAALFGRIGFDGDGSATIKNISEIIVLPLEGPRDYREDTFGKAYMRQLQNNNAVTCIRVNADTWAGMDHWKHLQYKVPFGGFGSGCSNEIGRLRDIPVKLDNSLEDGTMQLTLEHIRVEK